jgi:hypothetical protein
LLGALKRYVDAMSFQTILDKELSEKASRFLTEKADILQWVRFENIAFHPHPAMRSYEACHHFDGREHTIWLNPENDDFEALTVHEILRALLLSEGFPQVLPHPAATAGIKVHYLASLLSHVVIEPVIDRLLVGSDLPVYRRDVALAQKTAEIWLDARQGVSSGFVLCKWTLLAVLVGLDPIFPSDQAGLFLGLLRRKFPDAARVGGERLADVISRKGFGAPGQALGALVHLRDALGLRDRIAVIDVRSSIRTAQQPSEANRTCGPISSDSP